MRIYKITNTKNTKIYIGQTIQKLQDRLNHHFRGNPESVMYRAGAKHGRENFTIEEIDSAMTIEELNEKEIYWIAFYDSTDRSKGYNLMSGGGNKGTHSEESKLKMSKSQKASMTKERKERIRTARNNISDEAKKRISDATRKARLGTKQSLETIEKRASKRRGYKWSEESKKKSSETQSGRKKTPEQVQKLSERMKGKPANPKTIEALIKANTGRKATLEQKEKYRLASLKREDKRLEKRLEIDPTYTREKPKKERNSIEARRKISEAMKGKSKSEETKQKMRKPKSPEHIENMRKAQQLRKEKKNGL
jgi:group I intron endonuclease